MKLYLLHGFLGRPSDWDAWTDRWPDGIDPVAVDLFADPALDGHERDEAGEDGALTEWAIRFGSRVERETRGAPAAIVGYSLGGRLALHALLACPAAFSGAALISCHPGLGSAPERQMRLEEDRRWARRFIDETWSSVITDWDHRAAFGGALSPFTRREDEFDRRRLARSLVAWSLGRQGNLVPPLRRTATPTLWLAGEYDERYASLAGVGAAAARGKLAIVPGAAHRAPWEQPEKFMRALGAFFSKETR